MTDYNPLVSALKAILQSGENAEDWDKRSLRMAETAGVALEQAGLLGNRDLAILDVVSARLGKVSK